MRIYNACHELRKIVIRTLALAALSIGVILVISVGPAAAQTLTTGSVHHDEVTLTLSGHVGDWYYRYTSPQGGPCSQLVTGTNTLRLLGLTGGTRYVFEAYSDSSCSTVVATSASFITPVAVHNTGETDGGRFVVGRHAADAFHQKWATGFTTGDHSNGYILKSITAVFKGTAGDPGNIGVKIYDNNNNVPNTLVTTLTGSDPDTAGNHTYTCSGASCTLTASTRYHLVVEVTSTPSPGNYYQWGVTASDTQTNNPSTAGWEMDNSSSQWKSDTSSWNSNGDTTNSGQFSVSAALVPTLAASNITATGATLTISHHADDWYHKYTSPTGGQCSSAVSGTTATVTGLTPGVTHTFKAYSDSGCTTELATASDFTTLAPTLTASSITSTGATLTISLHADDWYHKYVTPLGGQCSSAVSGTTATVSGLTPSTTYTFAAYPDASCGLSMATASSFTTSAAPTTPSGPGGSPSGPGGSYGPVTPSTATVRDYFADDDGSIFEEDINKVAANGITKGCNAAGTQYCPDQPVTRAQMASFLARALKLPTPPVVDAFADTADNYHRDAIAAIAKAGITKGCNTAGTQYCPDQPVTRAQMASFLARALKLPTPPVVDAFADTADNYHRDAIAAIAKAGITKGCNTARAQYCPDQTVTRAQMAAFLSRALKL